MSQKEQVKNEIDVLETEELEGKDKDQEEHSKKEKQRQEKEQEQHKFICPECGRGFNSKMSLDMHVRRVHKVTLTQLMGEESPAPPKEGRKGKVIVEEGELEKLEEKIKEEYEKAERLEASIPDPYRELYGKLIKFGLSKKDALSVVDYMKSYDIDDVFRLRDALINVGMKRSRIAMFLDSWIADRHIRLHPEEREELGLEPEPEYYYRPYRPYGYRYRRLPYENDFPQPRDNTPALINSIANLISRFQQNQPMPQPNNSSEVISMLQQQNQKLQERIDELERELHKKEREMLRREIESLKAEIRELKEDRRTMTEIEFKDRRWQDFSQKVDRILSWIEAMGRPRTYPPEYEGESEATPTEEELRELGISEEWIEEE